MKVLYLAHHALGDVIMKVPALNILIDQFGVENVYLTVQREYIKTLLHEHLSIPMGNMLLFHSDSFKLRDYFSFIRLLRQHNFEYYLLPPSINQRMGKYLYYLSRSKRCITMRVSDAQLFGKHKVLQNLFFLSYFKEIDHKVLVALAEKHYHLTMSTACNTFNVPRGSYIIIHPGCGEVEAHKRYPIQNWVSVITEFLSKYPDYKVVLTGMGKTEAELNQSISKQFKGERILNLSNQLDLQQFMYLIDQAKLFLSGDCGPAHLASILDSQLITLFGPTDPGITGPFKNATPIKTDDALSCMPCYGSEKYGITGCGNNICMQSIATKQVLNKISEILHEE